MQKVTRYEDINFETNLRYDDVIRRAEEYVQEIEEPYEINKEFILYDKESYITKKPIWYVEVIHEKLKVTFPDSYEYIAISDIDGIVEYIQNDHGRIIEKKYELHVKKVRNISRCQMKLISKRR